MFYFLLTVVSRPPTPIKKNNCMVSVTSITKKGAVNSPVEGYLHALGLWVWPLHFAGRDIPKIERSYQILFHSKIIKDIFN